MTHNLFDSQQSFAIGKKAARFYSLPAAGEGRLGRISRLPVSIRLVLESVLRNCDARR